MSTPSANPPTSNVEQTIEGLTINWIMDGRIIVFTIRDVSRTAADAWVNALESSLSTWPVEKPYLALYDLNFPGASITSYVRARLSAVVEKFRDVYGRTAVFMPKTTTVMLLQLLFRGRAQGKRQRRIFTSYDDALNWLKELLD